MGTVWGKFLSVAALFLVFVALGCSSEKDSTGKSEQKMVAQETVAKEVVAPAMVAPPVPPVTAIPESRDAQPVKPTNLSLRIHPEEFRIAYNKTSELLRSKLRIKKLVIMVGAEQDTFEHIFNDNLYLNGKINKGDGYISEITLQGLLNGSLSTTVDLSNSIRTIVTVISPKLSGGARDSVLNALGINNDNADIYSLDRKVSKNGTIYWVKSSKKAGLQFGAKKTDDS